MELTVGAIVEGKVKTITNFGAFITLPGNKTGMVHISEVANAYVSDIRQHLTEGQDVKVVVIGMDNGKINLSIKRLEPKPERPARSEGGRRNGYTGSGTNSTPGNSAPRAPRPAMPVQETTTKQNQSFEEKLKQFMSESDSKISSIRQYSEHRTKSRRR